MSKQNIKSKSGFTIIEVVLVLAIAGLIFLMVFVALPALQRSQRDTQRRNDVGLMATALTNYQTSNNNTLPADNSNISGSSLSGYLGDDFKDPSSGTTYTGSISTLTSTQTNQAPTDTGNMNVYKSAFCDSSKASYKAGSSNYAIVIKLEGSGTYCVDNS